MVQIPRRFRSLKRSMRSPSSLLSRSPLCRCGDGPNSPSSSLPRSPCRCGGVVGADVLVLVAGFFCRPSSHAARPARREYSLVGPTVRNCETLHSRCENHLLDNKCRVFCPSWLIQKNGGRPHAALQLLILHFIARGEPRHRVPSSCSTCDRRRPRPRQSALDPFTHLLPPPSVAPLAFRHASDQQRVEYRNNQSGGRSRLLAQLERVEEITVALAVAVCFYLPLLQRRQLGLDLGVDVGPNCSNGSGRIGSAPAA